LKDCALKKTSQLLFISFDRTKHFFLSIEKKTVLFHAQKRKQKVKSEMTIEKSEDNNTDPNDIRETDFLTKLYRKWCQENNCQVRALTLLKRQP
jgi:hypothetical protein